MVQFGDLEDFETYKIEKIASHNLGDNENRLIDWSGLLEEAVQEIALSDLLYYGDNQYREPLKPMQLILVSNQVRSCREYRVRSNDSHHRDHFFTGWRCHLDSGA